MSRTPAAPGPVLSLNLRGRLTVVTMYADYPVEGTLTDARIDATAAELRRLADHIRTLADAADGCRTLAVEMDLEDGHGRVPGRFSFEIDKVAPS